MDITWEIDPATTVKFMGKPFRKAEILAEGRSIASPLRIGRRGEFAFALADGRRARVAVAPTYGGTSEITLTVDGRVMAPSNGRPFLCKSCGAMRQPNDRYCEGCGAAAPPAGRYIQADRVAQAGTMIWVIAALFAVGGAISYFLAKSTAAALLQKMASLPDDRVLSQAGGHVVTVARLRDQLLWQPAAVLTENLILAGIMCGLALWARRSPLPAIIVAAAIYGMVLLVAALQDPLSLARGSVIKVMVILALYRGVRAALAMRAAA